VRVDLLAISQAASQVILELDQLVEKLALLGVEAQRLEALGAIRRRQRVQLAGQARQVVGPDRNDVHGTRSRMSVPLASRSRRLLAKSSARSKEARISRTIFSSRLVPSLAILRVCPRT